MVGGGGGRGRKCGAVGVFPIKVRVDGLLGLCSGLGLRSSGRVCLLHALVESCGTN